MMISNCDKTADEEEDDGGDNNQPTVNPKSHLGENYDEDNDADDDNDDSSGDDIIMRLMMIHLFPLSMQRDKRAPSWHSNLQKKSTSGNYSIFQPLKMNKFNFPGSEKDEQLFLPGFESKENL